MQHSADDDLRVRAHNVNDDWCAELVEVVGAYDYVIIIRQELVEPRPAFPKFESYQAALSSLWVQVWTTGSRLKKSIAAMMRSLSSCLDATRMWRSTDRASLEKKPSIRLSQESWGGVKVYSTRW